MIDYEGIKSCLNNTGVGLKILIEDSESTEPYLLQCTYEGDRFYYLSSIVTGQRLRRGPEAIYNADDFIVDMLVGHYTTNARVISDKELAEYFNNRS